MSIAIVLGTFNRLGLLQCAVQSIRNAIDREVEQYQIIVVDGGSTDGTQAWIATENRRRVSLSSDDIELIQQHGPLTGAVAAFNLGFARAVEMKADFIAHFNDDAAFVTPGALSAASELMYADPTIGEVAFAFDLRGGYSFDYVNGKPYANFGLVRREAGEAVARAQGDPTGKTWWNPIYRTYGADTEFGCWLWKLGWTVHAAPDLRVHDCNAKDGLRESNDGENGRVRDNRLFWQRWGDGIGPGAALSIQDPSRAKDAIEAPRCEGDHAFETICNACNAAQPDGPCSICPHIGSPEQCRAEHFMRRPCRTCGSADLRTVRVRPPLHLRE